MKNSPLLNALLSLHVLIPAPHDAALLSRRNGLACEVIDTVVEALINQFAVHLHAVLGTNSPH